MLELILIFTLVTVVNVILSTLRSIWTINGNKWLAATINAVSYGFYTWLVVLTATDFSLAVKIAITALANFVGVYIVKFVEEKSRKDKMWKVEMAIPKAEQDLVAHTLKSKNIPYNYIEVGSWVMFNCYCYEQKDTAICVSIAKSLGGKVSAYESKPLM